MKSIFGEAIDLLRQVIEETNDGYRLRATTRCKIKSHIANCEDMAEKFRQVYSEQWAIMGLPVPSNNDIEPTNKSSGKIKR